MDEDLIDSWIALNPSLTREQAAAQLSSFGKGKNTVILVLQKK
jgi:hypothetical protein